MLYTSCHATGFVMLYNRNQAAYHRVWLFILLLFLSSALVLSHNGSTAVALAPSKVCMMTVISGTAACNRLWCLLLQHCEWPAPRWFK
jgi:hypothetical protein